MMYLKKWDPEHFELYEDFDGYLDNDGLEDIIWKRRYAES